MSDVHEKLVRARMRARMGFKYFGSLLYRMPWTEVPGHGTMSVDVRGRIRVDPQWVEQVSTAEVAGAFVHEVGHLVLRHGRRFESHLHHRAINGTDASRLQHLWNMAGDLEWNETIRVFCQSPYNVRSSEKKGTEPLLSLTDGALLAEQFGLPAGESAEFYFDRLCEMPPPRSRSSSTAPRTGGRPPESAAKGADRHPSGSRPNTSRMSRPDTEADRRRMTGPPWGVGGAVAARRGARNLRSRKTMPSPAPPRRN